MADPCHSFAILRGTIIVHIFSNELSENEAIESENRVAESSFDYEYLREFEAKIGMAR